MTDRNSNDVRPPGGGPDDVANLVRQAGKRPPIPDDELARIKAATYVGWREKVGQRPARRRGGLYGGLAAAAMVVMAISGWYWIRVGRPGAADAAVARVEAIAGPVTIQLRPQDASGAVAVGQDIPIGARLTTTDARIALRMPSGHSIRVDVSSQVHVIASNRVGLDAGAVYVDSGLDAPAKSLAILTPAGAVREIGTQFETRLLGSSLRVRVREGVVSITEERTVHEVSAGSVLEIAADGSITRTEVPVHGPEWAWVDGVTPMLDVQGRPLKEFVEWIARERGWTLTFADAWTEKRAATITVDGSIEGLTLDEALETVFATCRLTYRVDAGVFLIGGGKPEARR